MSLYRKYRPQNFQNLVGQDHVRITLLNAIKEGRLAHAYLFSGPRGTGKTSTARLIAKAINCTNRNAEGEPCEKCEFCVDLIENRLIDLIEIDAASNRGIDEMRDLKEKINFAPTRAKSKIYIIDEVHMLTKEAFNALLKTLEEPPENTYFILATTEIHKVPETIISRCQRFDFKRIDLKVLMTRLSYIAQLENIAAEDRAIEAIARNAEGGLRDAIGLMEQLAVDAQLTYAHVKEVLGISDSATFDHLYEHLQKHEAGQALQVIHDLHSEGAELTQFTKDFLEYLRQRMLAAVTGHDEAAVQNALHLIDLFSAALDELRFSAIPELPLEMAIIEATITPGQKENIAPVQEKISESKETAIPVPMETETAEITNDPVVAGTDMLPWSLADLTHAWPRVMEHCKMPTLKRSLKDAIIMKVAENALELEFSTTFHMEKVMEHGARADLEQVIRSLFGKSVKVTSRLKPIAIQPVVEEDPLTQKALEIFGGEIVE